MVERDERVCREDVENVLWRKTLVRRISWYSTSSERDRGLYGGGMSRQTDL